MIRPRDIREQGIESLGRFYGTYQGIVLSNKDPLKSNRLLVRIPEVYGDTNVSRLAMPNFGIMGPGYGTHFLPKVNAIVSITFRQGDQDYPYWSPGPWANQEHPTEFEGDEIFGFKSRTGHIIAVDDENNWITVQHKDGYHIELKEEEIVIGNDVRIKVADDGVYLGKADDLEYAVLGDTLKSWLETTVDVMKAAIIDTPNGPGAINEVTRQLLDKQKQELNNILAKY